MKVNINGTLSLLLIIVIVLFILIFGKSDYVLYSAMAIILYISSTFYIAVRRPSKRFTRRQRAIDRFIDSQNAMIGIHLAFIFMILGIFLGLSLPLQFIYFILAIIVGLMLPFILLESRG